MSVTAMPEADKATKKAAKKAAKEAAASAVGEDAPKKSKKKLLIIVVGVLVLAAAAWFVFLKPAPAPKAPEPGAVVSLEPIQVNLSGGHYLKLAIALQATADVKEELDGSRALDTAIELFSGRNVADLMRPGQREKLKDQLVKKLDERYEGEVMDVYFTDFVTQ